MSSNKIHESNQAQYGPWLKALASKVLRKSFSNNSDKKSYSGSSLFDKESGDKEIEEHSHSLGKALVEQGCCQSRYEDNIDYTENVGQEGCVSKAQGENLQGPRVSMGSKIGTPGRGIVTIDISLSSSKERTSKLLTPLEE